MTPLTALLLPIIVTTVLVFVASSLLHTILPWHNNDFRKVPDEPTIRSLLGPQQLPPGDYMIPHCSSMKEFSDPEHTEKLINGPVMRLTVIKNGIPSMAPAFIQWTIAILVATTLIACVAAAALAPGASRHAVWHLTGLVALGVYAFGSWPESIWLGRSTMISVRDTIDAAIFAIITAGVFGWFWPAM